MTYLYFNNHFFHFINIILRKWTPLGTYVSKDLRILNTTFDQVWSFF